MSASTMPPGGLPKRGPPPAKAQPPEGATGQLLRKPVPAETSSSAAASRKKPLPDAKLAPEGAAPPLRAAAQTGVTGPRSEQAAGAFKPQAPASAMPQSKKPVSNFSLPRVPAGDLGGSSILNSEQTPIPAPLRTRQPGSVAPGAPDTTRPGAPIPPSSLSGLSVPDVLRPGGAAQGQSLDALPKQPGPAPSGPVPKPAKSSMRKPTADDQPRDQDRLAPLRVEKLPQADKTVRSAAGVSTQNPPQPSANGPAAAQPTALNPRSAAVSDGPRMGLFPKAQLQAGATNPFMRKPVNPSSPPRPAAQTGAPPGSLPPGTNPLRSAPPDPTPQPGANPSVYRPSGTQKTANAAPPPPPPPPLSATNSFRQGPPLRGAGSSGLGGPSRQGPNGGPGFGHAHSQSVDSNRSMASTDTATSTTPLNGGAQRQNTVFSQPARQNTGLSRAPDAPGGGGYYNSGGESGAAQTPYMSMLLSLDKIPRMHNILVSVFVWILLAGFVIIPGSFTSPKRKQENESVRIPLGGGVGGSGGAARLALTPANTAAMVVGFVCIVAGTFGCAWLGLRWRRNYVWLLNKLYLPLILTALAGALAAVVNVYTQQVGEWSTQAVIAIVIETSILGVSLILFFLYNYWLLRRVRSDHEKGTGRQSKKDKKEKKKRKKKKERGGFLARFKRARKKPSMAPGSIV